MPFSDAAFVVAADSLAATVTHLQVHSSAPGSAGTAGVVGSRAAASASVDGDGDVTWTATFTGLPASQAVTHVTYWSASSGGTFYGVVAAAGNASESGGLAVSVTETSSVGTPPGAGSGTGTLAWVGSATGLAPNGEQELGWFLTTSNTGLAGAGVNPASLPVYSGPTLVPAGTTISLQKITTALELSEGGITLDRCWVQPTTVGSGLPVIQTCGGQQDKTPPVLPTIKDCDIEGTLLSQELGAFTLGFFGVANLYRNRIWGMGSGIAIIHTGTTLSPVIEGNYVHGLTAFGDPGGTGNHSDAFTVRGYPIAAAPSRTCTVRYNRFDCSSGNDSGACFIQANTAQIGNVKVIGNMLEGGGYNLVLEDNAYTIQPGMEAHNNRFLSSGPGDQYGPGYTNTQLYTWQAQSENYRYDAASPPDYKGLAVSL